MLRNITALRQGLKSIDAVDPNDASLDAARAYFSLFPLGAEVSSFALVQILISALLDWSP